MKELIKKILPESILNAYHYSLAWLGAFLYRHPSRKLTVIGVTGTGGKSTVVNLTTKIFREAGYKVASMSSIQFTIDGKKEENKLKMTMPGRMRVQRFLKKALKVGCKYVIMEVTSEGIKQHRHQFINFDTAVFTNLTPEHIEAHGGFENYRSAKVKLFKVTKGKHIINIDDKNSSYFLEPFAKEKIEYGMKDKGLLPKEYSLLAKFNIYNGITATKIAMSQGISLEVCQKALSKVEMIPGRMEVVATTPFKVVVDYAFTPDALEQVYQTVKEDKICVLGACGGGRDKWKRPILGRLAEKYCEQVIVTNEDPYEEDPMEIIDQVVGETKAEKILDREQAIKKALKSAKSENAVIITGKGSEPLMCVAGGRKIPWSDKKIVLDFLASLR